MEDTRSNLGEGFLDFIESLLCVIFAQALGWDDHEVAVSNMG